MTVEQRQATPYQLAQADASGQAVDIDLDADPDAEGGEGVSIDDEMHDTFARVQAENPDPVDPERPQRAAPAADPAPAPQGEPHRAPDGKFLPAGQPAAPQAQPQQANQLDTPPQSLRPNVKAAWNQYPPEVREEFWKRETDFFNGINQYQAKARVADTLVGVVAPYKPIMDALGTDIPNALNEVLRAAAVLYTGTPEQKAAILRNLAHNHGIQLAAPGAHNAPASPMAPVIDHLQRRLGMVEGALTASQAAAQNSAINQEWGKIVAFGSSPEHKYFSDVREIMGRLMLNGIVADGDLAGAYEQACRLHPGVRAALETEKLASSAVQRSMEQARRVNAARRAGQQGVRSTPSPVPLSGKRGTMEETMRAAYDEIQARGD